MADAVYSMLPWPVKNVDVSLCELPLHLEAAHPGQLHIQHETAWELAAASVEEFLRRRETFHSQARRTDQALNRFAHRRIVVDHVHRLALVAHSGSCLRDCRSMRNKRKKSITPWYWRPTRERSESPTRSQKEVARVVKAAGKRVNRSNHPGDHGYVTTSAARGLYRERHQP